MFGKTERLPGSGPKPHVEFMGKIDKRRTGSEGQPSLPGLFDFVRVFPNAEAVGLLSDVPAGRVRSGRVRSARTSRIAASVGSLRVLARLV